VGLRLFKARTSTLADSTLGLARPRSCWRSLPLRIITERLIYLTLHVNRSSLSPTDSVWYSGTLRNDQPNPYRALHSYPLDITLLYLDFKPRSQSSIAAISANVHKFEDT
jgi:hypothetical protein